VIGRFLTTSTTVYTDSPLKFNTIFLSISFIFHKDITNVNLTIITSRKYNYKTENFTEMFLSPYGRDIFAKVS